ncbi:MAG: 5'/3'-nucleotidase SurE [Bilifractor sp.]
MPVNSSKKILITNDDGIHSDGLVRLAAVARDFGEVWVVAPDNERSSMSHSITLHDSFELWPCDFPVPDVHAWACTGTPGDCVRIGALNVVPGWPDYLFSGINYGYNAASDLQYSATVGAALEGSFQGIHSTAFSEDASPIHEVTDHYLHDIIADLITRPLKKGQIWNVNFPGCSLAECRGIQWDRKVSDECFYVDTYEQHLEPSGRYTCHVIGTRDNRAEEGTDLRAIYDNYISMGLVNNLS